MYYLNDVESGGETEFYFQKRSIKPRKGTVVIAPAGFTHTHRGNVPISGDKYIITSWLLYNRRRHTAYWLTQALRPGSLQRFVNKS